jgi:hypothetical protein
VVVNDFDVISLMLLEPKADTILVIDANTVLTLPITGKHLEAIPWRGSQVLQLYGRI